MVSEEILTFVKALPILVRAGLNLISAGKRVIISTLKNNPEICPQLKDLMAVHLNTATKNLDCLDPLSKQLSNFQALVGFGLSILTTLILSQNPVFDFAAILSFIIIITYYFYFMDKDIEEPSIRGKHIPFTVVCLIVTLTFIWASTIIL